MTKMDPSIDPFARLAESLRRGERCTPQEQAAAKAELARRKAKRAAAKRAIKSGRTPIER